MDLRRASRYAATPAFWRGVATGMRSPKGRAGYDAAYRRALYSSVVGSVLLLLWVKRSRLSAGQPPLGTAKELELSFIGAVVATTVVNLFVWLRRRRGGSIHV